MNTMGTTETAPRDDDRYNDFLERIQQRFAGHIEGTKLRDPLFTTDAAGLFEAFLAGLNPERRQHYTCRACERFVERFGGLVAIARDGTTSSVLWDPDDAPDFFRASVSAIARIVARAKVTGVFLSDEKAWGLPRNKSAKPPYAWTHLAVIPSAGAIFKAGPLKTTSQVIAEKIEERGMLARGLAEFSIDHVRQARTLLETDALYRSEKCLGVAKWLLELHEARASTKRADVAENLVWRAVALAPPGFCHVRSTMIGTLLEDLASGMAFADVSKRFADKMHPLQYQRPTKDPSAGNIAQAEAAVEKLASAGALARRFAKIEDVEAIWKPKAPAATKPAEGGGVFAHLKAAIARPPANIEQPETTMTWEKFARTVLPEAEKIEFFVPHGRSGFAAMVTAVDPAAPPLLQWDREAKRNPVSWYLYTRGSEASAWNLSPATWVPVTAIAYQPSMWGELEMNHQGASLFVILEGARDLNHRAGGGFFPENLRAEYHAIRATMERFAQRAEIAGKEEATACGIKLEKGGTRPSWDAKLRVTSKGTVLTYKLDRWD